MINMIDNKKNGKSLKVLKLLKATQMKMIITME